MTAVQIYTRHTAAEIPWFNTEDGDYAQRYLIPFLENGVQTYIANVHNTEMGVVIAGETLLPFTVTEFHPQNSYTCSPYNHYISYGGYEEVQRLKNPPLEALIKVSLHPFAWLLRYCDLDRVVFINNWLLSTNLYPSLAGVDIHALAASLPQMFPDRAVVFRSVDTFRNPALYDILRKHGYRMLLSRQVWYMDPQVIFRKDQIKEDLRRLRRSPYEVVDGKDLTEADLLRTMALYNFLYLQKYSYYNPQFTVEFVKLAQSADLLHIKALRRAGQIDAVMGFFIRNGVMTVPFFGYDTHLPQDLGLYRFLTLLALQEGQRSGLIVHASAGAGAFKKLRGGKPFIEYNAVYDRHLPARRRLAWTVIKGISDAAIPLFQKYDL
ncbi:MAG: GNAT family N-acetyltransferase [Chloroflexota bacterium]